MLSRSKWWIAAKLNPTVFLLIVASTIGAVIASFAHPLATLLLFGELDQGQYWRLITPIFLHFGLVHLIFNSLWLSLLGPRIEQLEGSMQLAVLVLITGAISNIVQYSWSGMVNFGGMSGVIYALLGYIWSKNKLAPHELLQLPEGMVGFMVVWLLICMTGIIEVILGVAVANAAHVGGLVAGILLGCVFGLVGRCNRNR